MVASTGACDVGTARPTSAACASDMCVGLASPAGASEWGTTPATVGCSGPSLDPGLAGWLAGRLRSRSRPPGPQKLHCTRGGTAVTAGTGRTTFTPVGSVGNRRSPCSEPLAGTGLRPADTGLPRAVCPATRRPSRPGCGGLAAHPPCSRRRQCRPDVCRRGTGPLGRGELAEIHPAEDRIGPHVSHKDKQAIVFDEQKKALT